jgi:Flp pilus assembly protein TadG
MIRNAIGRNPRYSTQSGSVSMQILVLLVPVFFGLMGFAVDLGRLYMARAELKSAANSMALAAASRLISTEVASANAETAAQFAIAEANNAANKYDFGGLLIGQTNGSLNSEAPTFAYYDAVAAATGEGGNQTGSESGSSTAKAVRVTLHAEAPLVFWRFLSLAQEGKVNLVSEAIAGVSAPLCTACGIEPFAIAALSTDDTTDFGFTIGTRYTFGYLCNGNPPPSGLLNATQRIPYVLLNRYNTNATTLADENTQLYRIGAQGLPPSTDPTVSCLVINQGELIWASATANQCNSNSVVQAVTSTLCGLDARFESTAPTVCSSIQDVDTLTTASPVDTDLTDLDDYTQYTGNGRRIITVPIVDTISATASMTVLGFRQFLLEPGANTTALAVPESNGRFAGLYVGTVMPLKQGRFDGGCQATTGPGKVVLFR